KILSRHLETVDADAEPALMPYEGQQWLFVTGLRYEHNQTVPISWHEVWVHPDYRSVEGVQGFITRSIFRLVEQQFNVSVARVHPGHLFSYEMTLERKTSSPPTD